MKTGQTIHKIRTNNLTRYIIVGTILFFAALGVLLSLIDSITHNKPLDMIAYFTNQSNILVVVVLSLYFFNKQDEKWYRILSIVALVDILMTGLIYHFVINGIANIGNMSFNGQLVHTITPLLFPVFYYLLVKGVVTFKQLSFALVHPLIYFSFFMIFGGLIKWYPYDFLNPTLPNKSLGSVAAFSLGILLPIILVFTLVLATLKNLIEKRQTNL
ncbi:conserved hypothetical protein [Alteracholeplasma palmae J233]|uniref:Integral membrane protein n=1 Tax=Alteracholeplasma palmae (strain ATCC 49389 / J233) TaxID=1318466 RepID=U4KPW1_ALTPJ|nr:Pr6Pr family membrane protein [Alteracholeplasma palmae]CCV64335.1 conserved hypothetical protein [Alteracholeplasma palmae J233]